jgi:mannose-6-phosphate isomerase-like protein (cupin superfamily)
VSSAPKLQRLRRSLRRPATTLPTLLALALALGWASREAAFARERAALVSARTVTLDQVKMNEYRYQNQPAGKIGFYVTGDTPASAKFVTGRFVLDPGKTPHAPHTHVEEEVMIVASGHGEIFCDGKTTKVGPGSVMYTTPHAPHGIVNTGAEPLTFYFIKWASKPATTAQ